MTYLRTALGGVILLAVGGCVAGPSLEHPGPERVQQARAQKFDPYPDTEMAPPLTGARPGEYANPPPDIYHVQQRTDPPPPPLQWGP
ncbi:MAG: hypothetical protein ABSG68_12640 [Thermoguttaceae bacterium]|jgi:hypothetical protein